MPLYDYRVVPGQQGCELCSDTFEVRQRMDEERLDKCPQCGAGVQRIIGQVAFVQGHVFGEKMSRERFKKSGLRRMVKGDDGNYHDDTPK